MNSVLTLRRDKDQFEVQDIFVLYGHDFLERYGERMNPDQWKTFRAIQNCRTIKLGAHVDKCIDCGARIVSYNSCRDRHCPKCQGSASYKWVRKQTKYLINTKYFHCVFTVPAELNTLIFHYYPQALPMFFKAVQETLLELSRDPKHLGITPGITAVLHTWGQTLSFHPHIHCIVTGGGLDANGKWKSSGKDFFLPVKVMARLFRGKFLAYLKEAGYEFDRRLYEKNWVVYCKPPFKDPKAVLKYLGRYTHRVAIANGRIKNVADGKVTFTYKDYRDHSRIKEMTLDAVEFIRRFMMHILPSGFHKIRHYGILASRDKFDRIVSCQKQTETLEIFCKPPKGVSDFLQEMYGDWLPRCPVCRLGHLKRAPPDEENLIVNSLIASSV